MPSKRDLKKDINYVLGDIIEAVYVWELTNAGSATKDGVMLLLMKQLKFSTI